MHVGHLVHRTLERLGVRLRRLREAADLADVLERRGADLVLSRRRLEVVERSDVAAHASRLAPGRPRSPRRRRTARAPCRRRCRTGSPRSRRPAPRSGPQPPLKRMPGIRPSPQRCSGTIRPIASSTRSVSAGVEQLAARERAVEGRAGLERPDGAAERAPAARVRLALQRRCRGRPRAAAPPRPRAAPSSSAPRAAARLVVGARDRRLDRVPIRPPAVWRPR